MTACVVIPTLRRPDALKRALNSLRHMRGHDLITKVVVVDNDPLATAKAVTATMAAQCPFEVKWIHEPLPGIANARNAGVAAARTSQFIAFLDDDETASENWLAELLDTQRLFDADVVFGPIQGVASDAEDNIKSILETFFSRHGPTESGLISKPYGCGNSLLRCSTALATDAPFAVRNNERGGEDDALFAALQRQGLRFAWSAKAWVQEHAPPERSNLDYVLKRAFAYGQGPSQTAAAARRWHVVGYWMAVGTIQMTLFGAVAVMARVARQPNAPHFMRKASEGAGKVFWQDAFVPKFYGAAQLASR